MVMRVGVAFIAGFSERLAQDAITRASSAIPATELPEDPALKPPPRSGKPA
ncbi:hypothetical protein [Actinoplanes sp. NPDC048796]|uniref:hypothetical protein n=1 Tax=unclassified Actinoplanes TaxID=2626549 RepID=UPI0033F40BF9